MDPALPKASCRKARVATVAAPAPPAAPSLEALSSLASAITLKGAVITEAILHRFKDIENRSVRLPIGQWIALHTGKSKVDDGMDRTLRKMTTGLPASKACPMGVVVGLCWVERAIHLRDLRIEFDCGASCEHRDEITGERSLRHVHSCRLSPFAIGPFCNVVSAVIRLPNPVPCDGALSCWKLPEAVRGQILDQLSESPQPTIQHVTLDGGASLPRAWPLPWAGQLQNPAVERDPILLPERKPRTNKRAKGTSQAVAETQKHSRPNRGTIIVEDDCSDDSDLPLLPATCPPTCITPAANSKPQEHSNAIPTHITLAASSNPAAGRMFQSKLADQEHSNVIPTHITPAASSKLAAGSLFQAKLSDREHSNVIDISLEPERPSFIDVPSYDAGPTQLQRSIQHASRSDQPPESEQSQDAPVTGVISLLKRSRSKDGLEADALLPTPVRHRPVHATSAYRQLAPSTSCLKETLHTLNQTSPRKSTSQADFAETHEEPSISQADQAERDLFRLHRDGLAVARPCWKGLAGAKASPLAQQTTRLNRDSTLAPRAPPLEQTQGVGSRSLSTEPTGIATTAKEACLPVQQITRLNCDSTVAPPVSPREETVGVNSSPLPSGSLSATSECIATAREEASPPTRSFKRLRRASVQEIE